VRAVADRLSIMISRFMSSPQVSKICKSLVGLVASKPLGLLLGHGCDREVTRFARHSPAVVLDLFALLWRTLVPVDRQYSYERQSSVFNESQSWY
jgi:hypothetical protein